MKPNYDVLRVFVSSECRGCQRAKELAAWVRREKPQLPVEVIDLSLQQPEEDRGLVFAVPTYVYENKPIFLGNPSPMQLQTWLDSLDQMT